MIKIEISDVLAMDSDVLRLTGEYFIEVSMLTHPSRKIDKIIGEWDVEEPTAPEPVAPAEPEPIVLQEEVPDPAKVFKQPSAAEVFAAPPPPVAPVQLHAPEVPDIEEEIILLPVEVAVAPPPPVAPVSPGVELDSQGLPWDRRIHARTRSKMKDGSWKKARNMGPEIVKKVEAELREVQGLPPVPVTPAVALTVPVSAPPPPAPAAPTVTFADVMTLITSSITAGHIGRESINKILAPFGLPGLPMLATRLDLVPAVMAEAQKFIEREKANAAQ